MCVCVIFYHSFAFSTKQMLFVNTNLLKMNINLLLQNPSISCSLDISSYISVLTHHNRFCI